MSWLDDEDELRAFETVLKALVVPPVILATTRVLGFKVSTVLTSDEGAETAIVDPAWRGRETLLGACGTYPVERYATREEALAGHERWCRFIEGGGKKITMLGYGSHPPVEITLVGLD